MSLYEARKQTLLEQANNGDKKAEQMLRDILQKEQDDYVEANVMPFIRPATKEEYAKWLKGHLAKGMKITHVYDYDYPAGEFYIATKSFNLIPLYGAKALNIILPEGICAYAEKLGHNNLYYMKDYVNSGNWTPIYNNIED